MAQHGTMSTTFELRDAAIDRAKKRLEKYKRTAEKKEIDYDAYLDAKLRTDMRETNKYLAKVNESKMRKNKSKDGNKKDLPTGPGGLSQNQASEVQSKIREHIQSEIKKTPLSGVGGGVTGVGGVDKKRKKTQQTFDPLPLTQLPQLSSDPGSVFPGSLLPTADNFPFGPADFSALSDRDIQNVLGDVKQENPGVGYETASAVATSAAAAAAPIAVTTAAAATSPTTSDFYPAYQTNAALFQAAANPYLQQQYNAQYGQQMQWMQQQQQASQQQANTTTTQANNYTSETQQAHLHDFLSNQYS